MEAHIFLKWETGQWPTSLTKKKKDKKKYKKSAKKITSLSVKYDISNMISFATIDLYTQ
jgi:hypothetical protein